jgi:hypothetical protein
MTMMMKTKLPLLQLSLPNKLLSKLHHRFQLMPKQPSPTKLLPTTLMTFQSEMLMAKLMELKQKTHNRLLKIKPQQSTTTSIPSETNLS